MTDETLTAEAVAPEIRANAVPVKIHLKNGKTFIVDEINAWVYEENGVFASGHFKERSQRSDILVPYENVDYYELDFPRLQKFIERSAQEEASDEANLGT